MNRDFVDIEANAVPVGNQLPNPTPLPNAPQAIVQDTLANGAPVSSEGNKLPIEKSLAESANAPTVEQANPTPTGQVALVDPALPLNRADKQENVQVAELEHGTLPLLHEAAPVPNDPVPTFHGVGQQEQKVAEGSIVVEPQDNACAPPTPSVDVSQAENDAAVSQEGGANEGIVAQEPVVAVNNPVPVVDIENLQPAVPDHPVAIVGEAGRPVENGPSLLELIQALPEQLHELLVNGARLLTEQEMEEPPQRFFIVTTPKQERNGANTGAQAPIPAENVAEVVQAIAEPAVANEVPAVNVGNDVGDQAPPEPIVLPEEVRADELQDAPEQQAILLPYNPNIQVDERFIRRFAENTARYRHNDGQDFEVYSDSLGLQRNTEYTLDARLKRNLRQLGVTQKRKVQQHLVPAILAHQNAVVQTESGSGKTLAYAVPVIQLAMNRTHFGRGPLAVVLVPSREECNRIAKLFLVLASGTGVNVAFSYGETDFRTAKNRLREGCDILICTSSRFAHHLHENQIVLSDLRTIIVDCAEIMIDDTHTRSTLLDLLDVRQMKLQVVLITTTYNTNITSLYARRLEPIMDISSGHSLNSRVRVSTVALQTLWSRGVRAIVKIINDPSVHQIIIFLSHNDSCRRLYGRLQNNPEVQEYKNSMQYITTGGSQEQRDQTIELFYHNQFKVLLTTDVFALGLDFPDVNRVISFDIPSSSQLLTHRCGRTGRIVAGEATVLFDELSSKKKEEAEILRTFLSQSQKDIPEWLKNI